jgi:PAS domain S-box-containing protein
VELSGYTLELLRKDQDLVLYRGHSNGGNATSILLLTTLSALPTPETLKKIEHEYSLKNELDTTWALRPMTLSQYNERSVLVFEDPGGEPLNRLVDGSVEMKVFLRLAVSIADAVGQLHKRHVIHKDLKPSNVLVASESGRVWLTGFGIASRLVRERQPLKSPEFIAGTLAYMAPEQTGRMNRSIDSRTDLYAFGVTLYELLTGSLPFIASDPMEWVHSHIARQPVPPHERSKNIPLPISAIIMKLLAKTPEDRYQTAYGAKRDLERCLAEWENHGNINQFPLGEHDVPDKLLIPEKLYGRASEIDRLVASFDRIVSGGRPELVLVSGYAGIGKSSVVNELHKALVPPRALLASGKFDQYKRDIPYATLAQAFQSLIHPLLGKSEAELAQRRDALHKALDQNGQLIVDLVPELNLIIGEQPRVPELSTQDAQHRFQIVFRRFISVFARSEHPLALFLDDLQWLDAATLDLIEDLLTQSDVRHFMLIGAYRNNEVDPTHPLMLKLEAIRQTGAVVQDIVLAPLTREDLDLLIADALRCDPDRANPLTQLIHEKTAGNPFFAIQFIASLAEEGLLAFDHGDGRWSWDLNRIHSKGYTDNVVDLLVEKLSRQPAKTQNALKLLACLGNSTGFSTLQMLYQESEEDIHGQLWEAVRAGLIFRSEDSYLFLHDHIQEAAYSLITEQARAEAHLRIGRLLAERTPSHEREERIFEIVNQFNRAAHLITSDDERKLVAEFNLIAARRAKLSTAHASALFYLATGRALLTDESWETDYELIFSLECLRAECELLTADMESAEKRLSMLAGRATRAHDLAVVIRLQLTLYTASDRLDRGIEICLEYLRRGGTNWSAHPTSDDIRREYDRIGSLLGDRQIEDLLHLPLVANPDILDVLEVLTEIVTPAVFFDKDLCALVICRMVNLSLEHGNSDASCFAYVWFGIVVGPRFGNYEDAFRFGQLGYDLLGKRGLKRYEARTCMCFSVVVPWTKHARHSRDLVRHAFDVAYRMGDFTYAAYSFTQLVTNFLVVGDPLAEAQVEAEKGVAFAKSARLGLVVDIVVSDLQLIRTLRGLTNKFGLFNDKEFDEAEFEQHLASNPALADPGFGYWTLKAEARFFARDYTSAVDASLKAQQLLWAAPALLEQAAFRFYGALSHAAAWNSASPDEKQKHFEALTAHHKQLEIWAEHCPANFENRVALVGAEIARIEDRVLDAEGFYEKAIRSAHANGFIHNEAVAYEVAARFYAARGFDKVADTYLREARYCYLRWGADGKVKQLDHLYPHLRKEAPARGTTSTIMAPAELMDLATVIKVSQAVSGEMVLEKLIERIMRAAIEHAGAERGLLIFPRSDELQIEAEATARGNDVTVHLGHGTAAVLPESVVRYVMRTREDVILDDAIAGNPFSADAYIVQHRARSIACLPLVNQARLNGIIYLENNLTAHVFNSDRITVLKVLASQAAISLENTRLYRDLENREAKIRRLVDANILGITTWSVEGAILASNEAFLRMVQYDHEDVAAGRVRWWDMTPADWREPVERALAEIIQTGTVQPFESELFRKDGSRVPILVAGALFEEAGNEGVAFVLDLSEQKRAEQSLRRSESYLAQAQQLAHIGSWAWQVPERNALYLSAEWYRIYNFDPKEGMPTWEQRLQRIHPEDRALWKAVVDRAIAEKSDYDVEFRILPPHSTIKYIHSVGHPVLDSSGELLQFVGVAMDVTERKRAEEALHSSEAYLMEAQRLTHTGSCAIDGTSREILYWSEEMFRLFGFDPQHGLPIWDQWLERIHPEDRDKFRMAGDRTFLEKVHCDVEFRTVQPDGTVKHIHGTGHPVLSPSGELVQVVGTMVDVTERKRAEEARDRLRQLEADLAHISRVSTMGELTASLAHEIKQPIGAAVTNAEACLRLLDRDQPDLPEAREAMWEMVRDARRAADIIDRVRLLYQKGSPQLDIVDVNEVIRDMVIVLHNEANRHSVTMHTDLAEELPKVMADRVQLQQALMNLMLNGIEAMRDTRGELSIKSQLADDSRLLISIADTGVGLPSEKIDKIFNAFFTTKSQGTGLGLAITRSIVESHGGRIWATANSGRGATFSFTLPSRVAVAA